MLSIDQGLSQGMVFDLLETRDGFLWVCTKDGLNRYDGYNFKVFNNNPFDSLTIGENVTNILFEDSRGWLWIGLESKGLDVYDRKTGLFHHFPLNFGQSTLFDGVKARSIVETPDGAIWVLKTDGRLYRITVPKEWEKQLPPQANLQPGAKVTLVPFGFAAPVEGQEQERMFDLTFLADSTLLVTSAFSQYSIDPKTLANHKINEGLLPSRILVCRQTPYNKGWWIPSAGAVMYVADGKVTTFPLPARFEVSSMFIGPDKSGGTWLSVNNFMWRLEPGRQIDFSNPDITFDAGAVSWIKDRSGNLWVGTPGYGLRKLNPVAAHFHPGAEGKTISGLWAVGGQYFAKLFFNILPYDPKTGRLSDKPTFADAPQRMINMAIEPSGAVWLLGSDPNLPMGTLRRYPPGGLYGKGEKVYSFDALFNLFDPMMYSPDGKLWVADNSARLIRFDPVTERFDFFSYGHLFGEKINNVRSMALAADGNGTVWIGTQFGLVRCAINGQSADFKLFSANSSDVNGLNCNVVSCLTPDPDNPKSTLWIGTKGGGVNRMDINTGVCTHITTDQGLLNNVIYSVLPAGDGEFWCSSNRGLAKIVAKANPDAPVAITTFTGGLGLQANEFNTGAYFRTAQGELLFGGVNGLNHFYPEELRADTTRPPVFIVSLEINHQRVNFRQPGSPLDRPIESVRRLHLPYYKNNLSFEFAALDFTDPLKNRYRYRLVGLDKDWVEIGGNRFAHFNHLAPGTYELQVQGSNGESAWGSAPAIVIVIDPPWYRSSLAYLCYILLLVWGGWRLYQMQIRRVKLQEQLAFELRETERIREIEEVKTNFFNNVTHEFRTPITLIMEPLKLALPKITDAQARENVQTAENNSRKLLSLVNQLMDMAKLESGYMHLDLRQGDFMQTVRNTFESFLAVAQQRGIKLTTAARTPDLEAFEFDGPKVETVLNNLISNALKFTPAGGHIKLDVSNHPDNPFLGDGGKGQPVVVLKVTDNGIGIPPEALPKVFDRFYQVDASHTRKGEGTGIGLALSRELAVFMGGGLTVESPGPEGKGSVFTYWLPVRRSAEKTADLSGNTAGEAMLRNSSKPVAREDLPVVLIVEDNPEMRKFIQQAIGPGWQVAEASDGVEGVRKAVDLLPDIVVSDVMMPQKDGYTLCDELKNEELTAHIPVILLTAKAGMDSRVKGLRTGADDYLTKPFSAEELRVRMENLVAQRQRLRALFGRRTVISVAPQQKEPVAEEPAFLSKPDKAFLQKCMLELEKNLDDETLGVEEFAGKLFISRVQLHRKIKALTDQTPIDFIRTYRLERAMALLRNKEGNVAQVSQMVGFVNEKHFSTVFKAHFGVSPSEV